MHQYLMKPVCLIVLLLPAVAISQELELSLQKAMAIVLERNPEILAAKKQVDAAKARTWQAWAPENLEIAWEYESVPKGSRFRAAGEKFFRVTQAMDFPINSFLKRRMSYKGYDKSRMEFELVKLDLTARVKLAYFRLVATRLDLDLARMNLQLAKDFLQKARLRYEVGEAANLEYVKAKVEKARAENTLTAAQNAVKVALAEFNTLLVRETAAPVTLTDSLAYRPFKQTLEALKTRAFETHPRLLAMDLEVQIAKTSRFLSWGSFLPQLEANYFRQSIDGDPNFWGAEIGLSIPLWFPLRQRGEIQEATADLRQAEYERENVKNKLGLWIESAFSDVKTAEKQVLLFEKELLAEAEEVYRIAQRSYEEGESSYLELLEAQRTLIETRSGYIESLLIYNSALADLEQAVGGAIRF